MLNADMTQLTLSHFSFTCGICALKFLTKNSMENHQKVEHRVGVERTVTCGKCQKVMKPSSLKLHMVTHKEKTHVCKLCYAKFSTKKYLWSHQQTVHKEDLDMLAQKITEEDLTHECTECELKFVAEKFLESHIKSHSGSMEKSRFNKKKL